jgi:hypothetical protein
MQKKFILALLIILMPALLLISCSKSSADQQTVTNPPPGGGGTTTTSCDTAGMKYTTDVLPILQSHCYSCHGTNTAGSGGISLDSYNNLKTYADNGFLKGNITHAPGFIGMPYGQPQMDACSINKIVDWINRGALNN